MCFPFILLSSNLFIHNTLPFYVYTFSILSTSRVRARASLCSYYSRILLFYCCTCHSVILCILFSIHSFKLNFHWMILSSFSFYRCLLLFCSLSLNQNQTHLVDIFEFKIQNCFTKMITWSSPIWV